MNRNKNDLAIYLERRQRLLEDWQEAAEAEKTKLLVRIMDIDEEIEFLQEKANA